MRVVGGRGPLRVRVTEIADHVRLPTASAVPLVRPPIALVMARQVPEPHRAMKANRLVGGENGPAC